MIKNDVIIGEDGWLFLASGGHKQRQYLTGELSPLASSINAFRDNIISRHEYCENLEIPYLHFVFPTKDLVITSKLGERYNTGIKSLFDKYYREAFGERLPEYIIYPLEDYNSSDDREKYFYKLDTHMSSHGYLIAVKIILDNLRLPCNPEAYFKEKSSLSGGDLAKMLGSEEQHPRNILLPIVSTAREFNNIKDLPGNSNNIAIWSNDGAVFNKRLLLIGDSFISGCAKLLSVFFKDIVYIRSENFQKDAISLYSPDIVISSTAERYLASVKSDSDSRSVVFSNYGSKSYQPSHVFSDAIRGQVSFKNHPLCHARWREEYLTQPLFTDKLIGPGFANRDISSDNFLEMNFNSIGNDPQIIFPCANIYLRGKDFLILEIESSVDSKCDLFYQTGSLHNHPFSRDKMMSHSIKAGNNILKFPVQLSYNSQLLRLDPLSKEGLFKIKSVQAI